MNAWIGDLHALRDQFAALMLVTVVSVRGSAPREIGARMIVTPRHSIGSIGGGQLEYRCARIAFDCLREPSGRTRFSQRFPLGADLGQCCGGVVEVLFERVERRQSDWFDELFRCYAAREPVIMASCSAGKYLLTADRVYSASESDMADSVLRTAGTMLASGNGAARSVEIAGQTVLLEPVMESGMHIAIFGAGHVGSACVAALSRVNCRIRWIDSRRGLFPEVLPANVNVMECNSPVLEVNAMPQGAFFLIMTHSHPLDFDLCHAVLRRDDFAYCGLIGSKSKRRRFEKRLRALGLAASTRESLTCPIGLPGIRGKTPAEIAIGVTAQLLQIRDAGRAAQAHSEGQASLSVVAKADR
jgi:xanthine dehydrogenase accessory factor